MSELTINDGVTELGVTTFDGEKAQVSSRKIADVFGVNAQYNLINGGLCPPILKEVEK